MKVFYLFCKMNSISIMISRSYLFAIYAKRVLLHKIVLAENMACSDITNVKLMLTMSLLLILNLAE